MKQIIHYNLLGGKVLSCLGLYTSKAAPSIELCDEKAASASISGPVLSNMAV